MEEDEICYLVTQGDLSSPVKSFFFLFYLVEKPVVFHYILLYNHITVSARPF